MRKFKTNVDNGLNIVLTETINVPKGEKYIFKRRLYPDVNYTEGTTTLPLIIGDIQDQALPDGVNAYKVIRVIEKEKAMISTGNGPQIIRVRA